MDDGDDFDGFRQLMHFPELRLAVRPPCSPASLPAHRLYHTRCRARALSLSLRE